MKWNSTPVIALVAVLVFAAAAGLLMLAGGDDEPPPSSAVETPTPSKFGDPPRLGDNIEDVAPAHAQTVGQAATRPRPGAPAPSGVCVTVNFVDTPENLRWFHMAYDEQLVTHLTTVFPINPDAETGEYGGAVISYETYDGLETGINSAAVSVSDPTVPNAVVRQVVGWKFEVVP